MRGMVVALVLGGLALPTSALAGRCDGYVRAASSAKGDALVAAFDKLASCDEAEARDALPTFMLAAGDLETLVPLTLAGVRVDAHTQIWDVMQRVPYEHRSELARQVGAACDEESKVLPFLQGAYLGTRGTAFTSWTPALEACTSEELSSWLEQRIGDPPSGPYNEKYNALLTAFTSTKGVDALPALQAAAILVGTRGGPFNNLLESMQRAIQPASYRDTVAPEHQKALEEALVAVAKGVNADNAKLVADRLYSAGNEALAASLLPAVYPDRLQSDGTFLWAATATEVCDDDAVVHWVSWSEKPTRLDLASAITEPLRAAKAKLGCDGEPWQVVVAAEPFAQAADVTAWVAARVEAAEASGLKTKDREEKKVAPK